MPIGSFDLSYFPTAIAGQALPIAVCLYTPPNADQPYELLPNVRCLRIDYREGPEPPVARFQYLTGDALEASLGWPSQFETLWPIDADGNYVVQVDDRLVVMTTDPYGNPIVLFDGFAQIPQVDLAANTQGVTFVAVGVAARLWDTPISSRVQREAVVFAIDDGSADIMVQLPARFNPADTAIGTRGGYVGNAIGEDFHTVGTDGPYPVFVDPLLKELDDADTTHTAYWGVGGVLKYLMATQLNPEDSIGNPYVEFPSFGSIDLIVDAYAALAGVVNPATATTSYVHVRDYDANNKSVPEVFHDLLSYEGIVMNWLTTMGSDYLPITQLQLMRRDALGATAPKPLYLAADGSTTLDLSANNSTAFHLARDTNALANAWSVESESTQIEVTVYLAPLFTPNIADAAMPARLAFLKSNLTLATGDKRRRYRWYGADECAEGHWNSVTGTFVTTAPCDFSPVFPKDASGNPTYVSRFRPGSRTLISKDPEGKPLKAVLEIGLGAQLGNPALIVGGAPQTWLTVSKGWQILDDRLGIEITSEDPDAWDTGNPKVGAVLGITWPTTFPVTKSTTFVLRLTTVIESDQRISATAPKRVASPTEFTRQRWADGKDHFQKCSIALNSLNYTAQGGDGTNPVVVRDDTNAATAHATALRSAHEFPVLAGSATIPFITDYYQIGDRIQIIQGRNASLQINVAAAAGETPTYPWITAFSWSFERDRQETTLQLSDRRAEPQHA